jgi:hypothetical protein
MRLELLARYYLLLLLQRRSPSLSLSRRIRRRRRRTRRRSWRKRTLCLQRWAVVKRSRHPSLPPLQVHGVALVQLFVGGGGRAGPHTTSVPLVPTPHSASVPVCAGCAL